MIKIFLTYAKICTEKLPEPIFTCSENILKKQRFPKNLLRVWYILGLWEFFSDFWGKIFLKVFKTASYTFRHFDGKQFFFFNLLNFGRNSSFWLMTIFLLQNCQNWFLRIHGNTLIKKLFWKTLPRFCGPWAIYFLTFGNFFTERLSKLFCTCSENILKMRIFLIVLFLVHNQTLSKFFSDIRHKFFRKVLKTAFSMFRRTLWGKAFFFNVLRQFIFWLWAKPFLNSGWNFKES